VITIPDARDLRETTKTYQPLLTIEQVSDWLIVPVQTLYSWRKRRIGPAALKVGKHLRYRPDDVEQFLMDCAAEQPYESTSKAGA